MGDANFDAFGPSTATCPYCHKTYKTGLNWWCNMTTDEKVAAIMKLTFVCVTSFAGVSVILLVAGLAVGEKWFDGYEPPWWSGMLISGPLVCFLFVWGLRKQMRYRPPSDKRDTQ